MNCDALIIGTGTAGLTALNDLSRQGVDVLCLDARDRIGGRLLTTNHPYCPLPIELGAEFVYRDEQLVTATGGGTFSRRAR